MPSHKGWVISEMRGILLVPDNLGHIEGRINGQQSEVLTEFVKKSASHPLATVT